MATSVTSVLMVIAGAVAIGLMFSKVCRPSNRINPEEEATSDAAEASNKKSGDEASETKVSVEVEQDAQGTDKTSADETNSDVKIERNINEELDITAEPVADTQETISNSTEIVNQDDATCDGVTMEVAAISTENIENTMETASVEVHAEANASNLSQLEPTIVCETSLKGPTGTEMKNSNSVPTGLSSPSILAAQQTEGIEAMPYNEVSPENGGEMAAPNAKLVKVEVR